MKMIKRRISSTMRGTRITCLSVLEASSVRVGLVPRRKAGKPRQGQYQVHMHQAKKSTTQSSVPLVADPSFSGKLDQTFVDFEKQSVHVGCGNVTISDVQQGTARAVLTGMTKKSTALTFSSPSFSVASNNEASANALWQEDTCTLKRNELIREMVCTAVTATYQYKRMKSTKPNEPVDKPPQLFFEGDDGSHVSHAVRDGAVIGNAINDARTLGNMRPDECTPSYCAAWMKQHIGSLEGVKVRHILRGKQLKEQGLHLMHAVGRCAVHEPVLVVMEYRGNKRSDESLALVGKGLCFDSGGMNVKPYGSMESMHQDMMGAAAVMGTMRAVARLKLPVNVVAVAAFAENAIGPDAYLPSTIIRSLNGKTVEVLNTDAEGRLVLADALTFVQRKANLIAKPTTIVDLATLTGAILVGLGNDRAGLFANNTRLARKLMESGVRTNELLWPMPIGPEHTKMMQGGIADLVNCSEGRVAGSCTAAAFLQEFVEKGIKWAHLDIAGTGMGKDKASGVKPAGVPGFGVRLLVDYLMKQ